MFWSRKSRAAQAAGNRNLNSRIDSLEVLLRDARSETSRLEARLQQAEKAIEELSFYRKEFEALEAREEAKAMKLAIANPGMAFS